MKTTIHFSSIILFTLFITMCLLPVFNFDIADTTTIPTSTNELPTVKLLYSIQHNTNGYIFTGGYYKIGDGGGGMFYWDPILTKDDNGGTIIKPTNISGPGRWVRTYTGPVYPEWFGAKKDGTDDTKAVMSALEIGGNLSFLEGTYTLDNLNIIKSNQIIRGVGVNRTILDFKNAHGGDGLKISYNAARGGSKNICISDLTITDSRTKSECENLIKIEGGNTGHTPSQTSAFIDLQRVTIGSYNNSNGTALLIRNVSSMSLHQFNTAYQMKSAFALVIDNNVSINTGVITINNCYLQSMATPLVIKQKVNLLDSFLITNNYIANFDNDMAREVVKFTGAISSVVFEANHIEGRSTISPIISVSGILAASIFRGNHFSCGSESRRANNLFHFSALKLRACAFEDNEVLRLNDNGSCFQIDADCDLSANEPISIRRFWMNSTKAHLLPIGLFSKLGGAIQHD